MVAGGVSALFGPSHRDLINIVSSISETLEIPHILTHYTSLRRPTKVRVNIAPDRRSISQVSPTHATITRNREPFTR